MVRAAGFEPAFRGFCFLLHGAFLCHYLHVDTYTEQPMVARVKAYLRATKGKKTCARLCEPITSVRNCAGDEKLCETVRRVRPQASAEQWGRRTPRPSVGTWPCPILAPPRWPFWKSVMQNVRHGRIVRTPPPPGVRVEAVCRQGGHGEVFASPPSGQAGRWPWLFRLAGNNPFFLALATGQRRSPF